MSSLSPEHVVLENIHLQEELSTTKSNLVEVVDELLIFEKQLIEKNEENEELRERLAAVELNFKTEREELQSQLNECRIELRILEGAVGESSKSNSRSKMLEQQIDEITKENDGLRKEASQLLGYCSLFREEIKRLKGNESTSPTRGGGFLPTTVAKQDFDQLHTSFALLQKDLKAASAEKLELEKSVNAQEEELNQMQT